ncbi:IS110 family transposase [Paenibacillus sp. FSL E2-8871]|uniref:IS110 family transposase n=1 Tax=Paenibacillus odorifer TaxID=189426 RepID=A0A1R0Z7X9_9BACL|nr:IS110 family transposase [Paenibacillus odorifer]OME64193.1 IS110 family transposase [Paenibacillus odorifer]
MTHYKQNHIYVGLDLHKANHTAVIVNCWNERLGEIKIENKSTAFDELMKFVKKQCPKGLTPVYGLEDTGGNGRALAVHLVENKQVVKEVNSALSYNERMSNATTQKSDSWDAVCFAKVLLARLDELPDANPQDIYWTIGQLVAKRNSIVKHASGLKNQMHQQLSYHYPSYKKFFCDIDGKAALAFWEKYPAPHQALTVGVDELADYLRKASNNTCSTRKAEEILELVKKDGETKRDFQEYRDFLIVNMVHDMRRSRELIKQTEEHLRQVLAQTDYKLESMDGINVVTASELVAEIGDIHRFSSADKLARFAGIAPIRFSSGGKGKDQASGQGNRVLNSIFHNLAVQQIQVAKGKSKRQRNPLFYEFYQRKLAEGKTKKQALICVMRRLVNIIYSMMKNKTEYRAASPLTELKAG